MFNAPLSESRADSLIRGLDLKVQATVLDLGCGNGALLQRMAAVAPIRGLGVDISESLIAEASATTTQSGELRFVCADAAALDHEGAFDVIVCIGSEFIFGGWRGVLQRAKPHLAPGGRLLAGTVYWKQPPAPEYLALMNGENPHFDLPTTVQIAHEEDYLPLSIQRSNSDEWDAFESFHARKRYTAGIEQGQPSLITRARLWQDGYLRWGMSTMGFCFLLLQRHDTA